MTDNRTLLSDNQHNKTSNIWLKGPVCSPKRLILATLLSVRSLFQSAMAAPPKSQDWVILSMMGGGGVVMYLVSMVAQLALAPQPGQSMFWLSSLFINLCGYASIFIPGYMVIQYVRKTGYLERVNHSMLEPFVQLCVKGHKESIDESVSASKQAEIKKLEKTAFQEGITLVCCVAGLQVSFLTWGVLQEKIMTKDYQDSAGHVKRFSDAQFLVFVNRILAFALALIVIMVRRQPRHKAPLYKYSYCSLSNIMSSWSQYEALKFVSFPTQVLAKASKVIPVMIMGKIVSNKKYEYYEYIVAVLITIGMVFFLFGNDSSSKGKDTVTTGSGVVILIAYMIFDSFTSNWQGELFKEYGMSSIQMMAGVNLFSCLLTSVSLMQQGVFYTSLVFMSQFPLFVRDCVVLSICSATGQLFIYYTISAFGPVVFVIIMTVRQALAVVLSCVIYSHPLSSAGIIGVLIIFSALFLRIYCGYRIKQMKKNLPTASEEKLLKSEKL